MQEYEELQQLYQGVCGRAPAVGDGEVDPLVEGDALVRLERALLAGGLLGD